MLKSRILWIITLLIGLFACSLAYRAFISVERGISVSDHLLPIGLAALLALLQHFLSSLSSPLALRSIGQNVSYTPLIWSTLFSTFANATVPFPAAFPIRAILQKKAIGISYDISIIALAVETFVTFGSDFLIGAICGSIWLAPSIRQILAETNSDSVIAIAVVAMIAILGFAVLFYKKRASLGRLVDMFKKTARAKKGPLWGMASICLISYILHVTRFSLILYALGLHLAPGPILAAIIISYLAGVLSFIPMGLGVRDASLATLLAVSGIPLVPAVTAAAIERAIASLPYFVFGLISSHMLGRDMIKRLEVDAGGDRNSLR